MKPSFEQVMDEYGPLLSRVASGYEANLSVQQELYQEICVAIWQSLQRFEGNASLKTYILRVAHNRCITHVNSEAKRIRKTDDITDDLASSDSQRLGKQNLPETQIIRNQAAEKMLEAIRELNISSRQVITLFLEGLSYEEIAEVTGLSKSNVGVMINRIKKQLMGNLHRE
ncbi:RNA polymerase sigma factor [Ningiella sp. W23]|uniref:RNA polymerase sigma factor n=1 Tax=Ningiella sp. W23 TaxID=3023715 RepID=UPI003756A0DD